MLTLILSLTRLEPQSNAFKQRHEAHVEHAAQQLQIDTMETLSPIPLVPVCILKSSHHIILLLLCTSKFIKTVLAVLKPIIKHVENYLSSELVNQSHLGITYTKAAGDIW